MPSIAATRRGYLYQDQVAVVIYLKEFINGNIAAFYIDYPFGNKSIDVRHLDKNNIEIVYSVKSGNEFKKDKKDKGISSVKKEINFLKEYSNINNASKLVLIIREGYQHRISEYWANLQTVRNFFYSHPECKKSLEWLFEKLKSNQIVSEMELYEFCRSIELLAFSDNEKKYSSDRFSDIDDEVINLIDDIATKISVISNSYEYPSEILMYELYHLSNRHAGTGMDVSPLFLKSLESFFSHRIFLGNYRAPIHRDRIKDNMVGEIKKRILLIQPQITISVEKASMDYRAEGGSLTL